MSTTVIEERTALTHAGLTAGACRRGGPGERVGGERRCGRGPRSRRAPSAPKHAFARGGSCLDRRRPIGAAKPLRASGEKPGSQPSIVGPLSFYDPTTGGFLSRNLADAATRSAYGYVYGNPLNGADPSGLYFGESLVDDAKEAAGSAINASIEIATAGQADCIRGAPCPRETARLYTGRR